MKEVWEDVKGYEGLYKVSDSGRVKSLEKIWKTNNKARCEHKDLILKLNNHSAGYTTVTLYKNGKSKKAYVHRLILEAFVGKKNLQCNHKNGIKNDNRLENLEYATCSENISHSYKIGLSSKKGMNHHFRKLTEDSVRRIKFISKNIRVEYGYWIKLAKALGVYKQTIYAILNKKT